MKKPWFHILMALAEGDLYGSAIQDDVRSASEGKVRLWPATLYGSLEELVELGWIRELEPAEMPTDGRGRERYYRITPDGRATLRAEADRLDAMARAVRVRLGEQSA